MSEQDEELLAGVARGDPDIWDPIYRAYAKDVHATAQKHLRSVSEIVDSKDVQDIVHQTFVEAMEGGVRRSALAVDAARDWPFGVVTE